MANNRPTVPPDPKPAKLLRAELSRHRDMGVPFEDAWEGAIKAASRDKQWRNAFAWSEEEWRSCYERQAPTPSARAVGVLALPTLGAGVRVSGPDNLTPVCLTPSVPEPAYDPTMAR